MISNTITIFRLLLCIPFFFVLGLHGPGWVALSLFLLCGALDVVDGRLARALGETSRLGALLDLVGDRLLTLTAVTGLLVCGALSVPAAAAGVVLVARCLIVGSFGEALKGNPELAPSRWEHPKIAASFGGLGLAMSPLGSVSGAGGPVQLAAEGLIGLAALLTLWTLAGYARQTFVALTR